MDISFKSGNEKFNYRVCAMMISDERILAMHDDRSPYYYLPGGRVAILTFHSGEDRLVKKSFKWHKQLGDYSEIARDVVRPSKEECIRNSRAHSTKMRWAIKA